MRHCNHPRPIARVLAGAMLSVLLGACALPQHVAPGIAEADVLSSLGRPSAVHPLPAGKRLEYGDQGLNQYTWMVDLDAGGRVVQVRQVRTLSEFFGLRAGEDTIDTVRRGFGSPWRIEHYKGSGLTAWLYPYREDGVWNSMMAVHFDGQGRVARVENGPDPRFLGGNFRDD